MEEKSITPEKKPLKVLEFTEKIFIYLRRKYGLKEDDVMFLRCYCSDFSPERTAEVLNIPLKQVMLSRFLLDKSISDFCYLIRRHLKDLAYEELIKSVKQTRSDYLKIKALELIFKAEGVIKEPEINITITVDERKKMMKEIEVLNKELSS